MTVTLKYLTNVTKWASLVSAVFAIFACGLILLGWLSFQFLVYLVQ